jgi:hypothetical protein
MTERDKELPQQQDKPEGERADVEEGRGLSDAPMAPLQSDQAEGEPEDVDEDVQAAKERREGK